MVLEYILAVLGFACMLAYDICCCQKKQRWLFALSPMSGVFTAAAILLGVKREKSSNGIIYVIFAALAVLFAVLLIHTVFFAVHGKQGKLVDSGAYAMCRHPGFWFLLFLCLSLNISAGLSIWFTVLTTALNLSLVICEDRVVFPKMIPGYSEYKSRVPFLVPNLRSFIKR